MKKSLKPFQGIIAIALFFVALFVENTELFAKMGMFGTLVGELIFLAIAVLTVLFSRADFKTVFPIHKPKISTLFGSLMLWVATIIVGMVFSGIILYLDPRMLQYSQQLSQAFVSLPMILAFLLIAASPAICEEALFRGVFVNSLSGMKQKWAIVVITGVVFGIAHGSIYRFFPTAMLGMLFAYLVVVTDNMLYGVLLHFLNNAFSLGVSFLSQWLKSLPGVGDAASTMTEVPLSIVSSYLFYCIGVPFLLYIGNYLIHRGQPGYRKSLFPKGQRTSLVVILVSMLVIFAAAMVVLAIAINFDHATINMYRQILG